jgi:hypothetical protein
MASNVTRDEHQQLVARVDVLEREVEGEKMVTRHILEQTRRNSADLAGIRTDLTGMKSDMAGLAIKVDGLDRKVEGLGRQVAMLIKDLPGIVRDALREGRHSRTRKR